MTSPPLDPQAQAMASPNYHPPVFARPLPLPKTVKAIAAVITEIGQVQRGGHNAFFNYKYMRMDDIGAALTPLMGKHGIVILQDEINRTMHENRIIIDYNFTLYVDDEVSPPIRRSGMCIARDSKGNVDDKAINKCATQARKYALIGIFQIPGGDEPDNDANGGRQEPALRHREPVPGPGDANPTARPAPGKTMTPLQWSNN